MGVTFQFLSVVTTGSGTINIASGQFQFLSVVTLPNFPSTSKGDQFQFLSVVTWKFKRNSYRASRFSFFQLLQQTQKLRSCPIHMFQFLSVVTFTFWLSQNGVKVLVSFSCYRRPLLFSYSGSQFQFLSVVTRCQKVFIPLFRCFSFFQLLLTLRALDLHVHLRVYKS